MKKLTSSIVMIEVIISILLGLSNILDNFPKVSIVYFYISIIAIFSSLLAYIFYIHLRKPWSKETRPYFLKFAINKNFFKQYISLFKEKPFYNYNYRQPLVENAPPNSPVNNLNLFKKKITIIIEDDPVGFKTDFKVPAYFITEEMSVNEITELINADLDEILSIGIFFISTPSRRSNEKNVIYIFRNIGQVIKGIFINHEYRIISKIDSCLRSQYEPEYQGLKQGLNSFDFEIVVPSYIEEGRISVYGSSYLFSEKGNPIMLNKTEYSQVDGLKYKNSNISLWLEERTNGRLKRKKVSLIDINRIRSLSSDEVADFIKNSKNSNAIVFDLIDKNDISQVRDIIIKAELLTDKKIFYKFGPSMINSFVEMYKNDNNPAFSNTPTKLSAKDARGVLFAGSLSSVTKKQVETLRNQEDCSIVLISNEELLDSRFIIDGVRKKSDLIISKSKKDNTIIVTTEFWVEQNTQYPDSDMRDKALDYFSNISKLVNGNMDWIAFKGSDTAFNCLVYGIGMKKYYYCGHPVSGVNKIYNPGNNMSYFIIGGNVGDTNLLLKFNNSINVQIKN